MIPAYVKGMIDQQVDPNRHAEIVKDNNAIVSIDGGTGLGRIVGFQAMDIGIERTKNFGIGCVALGNTAHLGRIGAFAEALCGPWISIDALRERRWSRPYGRRLWQP